MKRLRTLYSDRKKESWITLSDLRRYFVSTTNEMLVSEAPCAKAKTEMPLRPNVPNSFPAIPGVCFMFSPTMAMVAKLLSACIGTIAPSSISALNSLLSTFTAAAASSSRTPMDVEFSDDACATRNTLMPLSASAVNIRLFTPITPTIDRPDTVISVVPLILEIPRIALLLFSILLLITVPLFSGLKVFLTCIGMFLIHTGYIVGG